MVIPFYLGIARRLYQVRIRVPDDIEFLAFEPNLPPERRKDAIYAVQLLAFSDARGAYDGRSNFYTKKNVGSIVNYHNVFNQDVKPVTVTFTSVAEVWFRHLQEFMKPGAILADAGFNASATASMVLTAMARASPLARANVVANSRSVYLKTGERNSSFDIGGGLELLIGYFQSARPTFRTFSMNVDVSPGIMYQPGPLLGFILNNCKRELSGDIGRLANPSTQLITKINRLIKGIHINGAQRRKNGVVIPARVVGLDSRSARVYRFIDKAGNELTVEEYLSKRYNLKLQFPGIAVVDVGRKGAWPLELCEIRGNQLIDQKLQLTPDQMKNVHKFAKINPNHRLIKIREAVQSAGVLNYQGADYLVNNGVTIELETTTSPARILPAPDIHYGNNGMRSDQARNGAWRMDGRGYIRPMPVDGWALITFDVNFNPQKHGHPFVKTLYEVMRAAGMNAKPCAFLQGGNATGNIQSQLDQLGSRIMQSGSKVTLLLCVLKHPMPEVQREIKRFGDCVRGVATQIVLGEKAADSRGLNQYCNNLALKINAKLGGINWMLSQSGSLPGKQSAPGALALSHPRTILMGLDTSHPPPGYGSEPSHAALVASVDSDFSYYMAQSRVQPRRREVVSKDDVAEMVERAILNYQKYHKQFKMPLEPPARLIMYRRQQYIRDGVSEGQFHEVLQEELAGIRAGLGKCCVPNCKITFIVVGKRHHVRMFPKDQNADKNGNCLPGTVLDQHITSPWFQDFYLLSHAGLLGTSRPAHYSLLHDDNSLSPDALQQMTYHLCHMYTRATRSVSIPCVVYYAHLVAARLPFHYRNDEDMHGYQDKPFETYQAEYVPHRMPLMMYWM
ncbi:hypothetical protein FRB96_006654 [Tulasnella sp. 330]|nr:hypothetical protein FRB96_006654 [Tulasnella sp. 330]